MKKMKKLLSMLLAVIMVLAMAAPSFAETGSSSGNENNGSIIIDNAEAQATYNAYKIFGVTYNGNNYAYSIDNDDSALLTLVQDYAKKDDSGLKLRLSADSRSYIVEFDQDKFKVADFAKELSGNEKKLGTPNLLSYDSVTKKASIGQLPLGYYFVTTTTGALCNLTTTDPSANIHDKNDVPFDKTIEDDPSVEIGQTITYTIEGKVPDTTGLEKFLYKVTDTMSKGLTFNKNVKIQVGDAKATIPEIITVENYEYDFSGDKVIYKDDGFELYIDVNALSADGKYGQPILVTYSATINDEVVTVISENRAVLEYTNDYNETKKSTEKKVEVYSSKIEINKYTKNGETKIPLADAEFALYRMGLEDKNENANKKYYYKYTKATGEQSSKVEWIVEDEWNALEDIEKYSDDYIKKTDKDGKASFDGLQKGTYYLLETKAPAGYNILDKAQEVEVEELDLENKPEAADEIAAALTAVSEVENNAGTLLPSTGGIGTTIFTAVGIILMAGAVFFVVRRRRA